MPPWHRRRSGPSLRNRRRRRVLAVLALAPVRLPLGLVLEGPFDAANAVEVLDFDDRRRGKGAILSRNVHVDVGITPQASFLHLAIGALELAQQQPNLLNIRPR